MKTSVQRVARPAIFAAALGAAMLLAGCGQDSPATLLDKARASLAKRDEGAAEIHLKNLLQASPDSGEGRVLLAGVYASNRNFRSAEKEWRRALELGMPADRALPGLMQALVALGEPKAALDAAAKYPASQTDANAWAVYWSGRAQQQLGQADAADRSFRAALAAKPDLYPAQVALIRTQASRGDVDGARSAIDALLANAPDLSEGLLLKADLQLARNDTAGARETLGRAITSSPRDTEARVRLVSLLIDLKDYPAATTAHGELRKLAPGAPITLHLQALLAFRQNQLDGARDATQQVLKLAPDYLPAVALAANVALLQNQLESAERYARQIVTQAPQSLLGPRLLAAVHLRQNEPARALQVARGVIDRGAKDPALLGIAGEAALRINDVAAATRYFEQATALDPRDAAKRTGLGLALLSAGKSEAGFADLEAASKLDPDSIQADLALITARLRARQIDQALEAIARLEQKKPDSPLPHNLRGTALLAKGDARGARAGFERALQVDPAFYAAAANLAQLDMRDRKFDDAKKRFEAILQKDPKSAASWLALAQIEARQGGRGEEVLKLLERGRSADPGALEPQLAIAQHHMQTGKPRDAVPVLQQALSQQPNNPQLLGALGMAYLRADEKQQAVDAYERLVRLDPASVASHMRLGEVKAGIGDTAGALASFRQAATLDPKAPAPQFAIAAMLVRDGKKEEARRIATSMQKALPGNPAGLALEGDLQAADQKWAEAAVSYRKALALQPSGPLTIKQHQALVRSGRSAEADAALRDGLKALPTDVGLRLYAGERAVAERRWKTAVELYEPIVQANPRHVVALNNLAWSLMELEDPRALKVAEDAFSLAPKAVQVMDTLGQVLVRTGDVKRGLELLRQAVAAAPKAPEYRLNYAQALARSGDKTAARAELELLLRDHPESQVAKSARTLADTL